MAHATSVNSLKMGRCDGDCRPLHGGAGPEREKGASAESQRVLQLCIACFLAHFVGRIETFIQSHAPCQLTVEATIGYEWFDTILAELGDWSRFRNADAVVSYAGLDPGVRSSDGKRHDLKISKAGSPLLRWILIELAHRMKHTTARWAKAFLQISRKAGKKKATVAVARRLLLTIFAMLRDGRAYQAAAA
ncbi:MAG: transposase [Planctomycetota bacterium]|nr:transposase [Planctomycetota bacterium]